MNNNEDLLSRQNLAGENPFPHSLIGNVLLEVKDIIVDTYLVSGIIPPNNLAWTRQQRQELLNIEGPIFKANREATPKQRKKRIYPKQGEVPIYGVMGVDT